MELEDLPFKIVADAGQDTEVLGRAINRALANALYQAAVAANPKRTIDLRHGARVIESHAPQAPPAATKPAEPEWTIYRFAKKREFVGIVSAPDRETALSRAIATFNIPPALHGRLEAELYRR